MTSTLESDIGELLVGGLEGTRVDPEFARVAQRGRVGGAILFRRNLAGLQETRALTDELHALAPSPLLVAVDQEGGRVQRLRAPFPELPPMRTLGDLGRKSVAHLAGRVLGASLRVMGFDQDYAPVLDVDSNPDNPVIGDRALGSDPHAVSRLGAAFVDGLQSEGVAACGKHFPGHGDTDVDSHLALPRLDHRLERLRAVELPPFHAAARADVAAIMSAHIVFSDLDPSRPATLAPRVLALLREEVRFEGVIVSDDLEMKAITDHFGIGEAAVGALAAGCDQLLICRRHDHLEEAFEAIRKAVLGGRLAASWIRAKADRVRSLKARYVRVEPAPSDLEGSFPRDLHERLLAALDAPPMTAALHDPTERP